MQRDYNAWLRALYGEYHRPPLFVGFSAVGGGGSEVSFSGLQVFWVSGLRVETVEVGTARRGARSGFGAQG